ncbi:MAG: hypothetical protein HY897_21620 [Deltaproteobacteria bacterium]|nr:hypothetical protein [Deltaproteobacteria bacterium]
MSAMNDETSAAKSAPIEDERMQAALLRLSMALKKDPARNFDELIDDIAKKTGLDRARFVDYVAHHREVIIATVKGTAR